MRGFALSLALVFGGVAVAKMPRWQDLKASVVKVQRGKLLVGLRSGGAAVYDLGSESPILYIPSPGPAPTDVVWEGNRIWWITGEGNDVFTARSGVKTPTKVAANLTEAPRRLSTWQGQVLVQGDAQLRFIAPDKLTVKMPEDVLPKDVAEAAQQGTVLSNWFTTRDGKGEGQLVVIRRYGRRQNDSTPIRDIASITGWSSTGRDYKTLGTYTRSLVEFRPANGPRVKFKLGRKDVDEAFGACDPGNLILSPDGLIALEDRLALAVPLRAKSWMPQEIPLRISPNYNKSLTSSGANLWWTDGARIFCGSVEAGAVDVYLPKKKPTAPFKILSADDDGLWLLHGDFIKRIAPEQLDTTTDNGFVRYAAGTRQPELSADELRLRENAINARTTTANAWDWTQAQVASLGATTKLTDREKTLQKVAKSITTDLQVGDILVRRGQPRVYIGDGEVAYADFGRVRRDTLELSPDTRIYRVFNSRPVAQFTRVQGPTDTDPMQILNGGPSLGTLAQRVPVIGLHKINATLGTDLFARVNQQSPFDQPYTPALRDLLAEAESWIGTPYVWGGNTKDGADCSGFVKGVFARFGINLPRHSQDMGQVAFGQVVVDELRFGDVLVYPSPKHVAIYVGGGKTIEAIKGGVGYSNVWRRDRAVIRRFLN
ncbi:MAG: C40 family peptidase [Chthonomonas sp.]|nr:C40 family peptidase [Chthonomonas sp.]